jgi:SAM-dependent methyltransferase
MTNTNNTLPSLGILMTTAADISRHLDIGCGYAPRNPLNQNQLYGCDLLDVKEFKEAPPFEYKQVDLVRQGIPYPDSFFDSISAFDFLEHVPRQSVDEQCRPTVPFIHLMSEIHRVLKPNGLLIASTPAYPHPEAFQDPTHVNIITDQTHIYFCGSEPYATRYGFVGCFKEKKVAFELQKNIYDRKSSAFKKSLRNLHRRWFKSGLPHLTWELIAVK